MIPDNTLTNQSSIHNSLTLGKELVYNKCDFNLTNLKPNLESIEYGACSFTLNEKMIEYRVSKITPTKSGQFVTIWKRNKEGITQPFDFTDDIDFIIITSISDNNFGQFIFPKTVLANKGVITQNGKEGKRGIRVYPPWDKPSNKQAQKTQSWQTNYFLTIKNDNTTDLNLAKKLLTKPLHLGE
jgi:hypothetical protein